MAIKSTGIFQLLSLLPKLEELHLDFQECKFLAHTGDIKSVSASLHLNTLTLVKLDFNSRAIVFFAIDLIRGSRNLQTLNITGTYDKRVRPPLLSSREIEIGLIGKMQLQNVELVSIDDSEVELCLIKSLLAYSSI
ncbi:F-box domain, Leucine-rich repeat domain, L domain-like protein [Artemisia annua]|uniref:F-box domain, Leucine-rich repeat domain, L domain-like protein n=1 Tax=Artemisia annua TaxID=35608 RepID=A0A2U1Q221_ARTAN|nr:F-box domain, Leucine-rich repeat domain, L domain-like protein [Artemisia annua]